MVTAYEVVFILETSLADEQLKATIDKYADVITKNGGVVDDIDRWDPRRLAYEIKGRREGVYIILNFRAEPSVKDELDRIFRISDDVLRHLIVKQDPKADRAPSKTRSAEYERREREIASRTPVIAPTEQPVTELPTPEAESVVVEEVAEAAEVAADDAIPVQETSATE